MGQRQCIVFSVQLPFLKTHTIITYFMFVFPMKLEFHKENEHLLSYAYIPRRKIKFFFSFYILTNVISRVPRFTKTVLKASVSSYAQYWKLGYFECEFSESIKCRHGVSDISQYTLTTFTMRTLKRILSKVANNLTDMKW